MRAPVPRPCYLSRFGKHGRSKRRQRIRQLVYRGLHYLGVLDSTLKGMRVRGRVVQRVARGMLSFETALGLAACGLSCNGRQLGQENNAKRRQCYGSEADDDGIEVWYRLMRPLCDLRQSICIAPTLALPRTDRSTSGPRHHDHVCPRSMRSCCDNETETTRA